MKHHSLLSKASTALTFAVLIAASLLAPAAALAKNKKPAIDPAKLAWPPPPEVARIRFLAEYHGEDVKGIKKQGFLERLAGVPDLTNRSVLVKPFAVAVDSRGRAYVSDTYLNVVFVFDFEKKTLEYRGDRPPANFKKPVGLAVDAQDRLFVSDSQLHTVTVFDADGKVLDMFGNDELGKPAGMAVDNALGRIYVADMGNRKVAQFNLNTFKFERWVGLSAYEKVEQTDIEKAMASPTNVAIDGDGLVYVIDTFMNRICVFDSDGEPVRKIGKIGQGPARFMRPRGVAIDTDGHVYVTDAMANLFQILTPEGKALMPIGGEGQDPGKFRVPGNIAIDKFNRVVVVDQLNSRIQLFRYLTDDEAAAESAKTKKDTKMPAAGK